ncbi:hypothetical protein [Nocardia sp. NPDC047038]|uniref:hypothetical protein n=1 Tax=Nocardia sp. NPDC047038 TaxID=3154338 RepID=UPI0033DB8C95
MNSDGGGIVLTMHEELGDYERGDVLIEDGKIAQVGPDLDADAEVLDCAGKIVLPDFVNSHHMFQTALRPYWSDALDHLVGSLTPGKRADVIALNARALNAGPVNHAPGAVVQHMDTRNVDTVIVDGRIVKRDGRLLDADVEEVLQQLERSAAGLVSRSRATDTLLTGCRGLS